MKMVSLIGVIICALGFSWLQAMERSDAPVADLVLTDEEYGVLLRAITAQKGFESFCPMTRNLAAACESVFAAVSPTEVGPTSERSVVVCKYWELTRHYNVMRELYEVLRTDSKAAGFIGALGKLTHAAHMQIHQLLRDYNLDGFQLSEEAARAHQIATEVPK